MKIPKVPNIRCREYVKARKPFTGHNLYAKVYGAAYVVFSYGEHFPMFIHDGVKWFENRDRYSVSTSKQHGQAHPWADCEPMNTKQMRDLFHDLQVKG